MSRRILSAALCLCMAVGLLAGASAFAAEISISNADCRVGGDVMLKVDLADNPGIAGMRLQLQYDPALTLIGVSAGDALQNLTFTAPGDLSENPVNLLLDGQDDDSTNGTILKLTFRVAGGTPDGVYPVTLSYSEGEVFNARREDIVLTLRDGAVNAKRIQVGDLSGDGIVNGKDLLLLRQYLAGGYGVEVEKLTADLNDDGEVNAKDVTFLRRYLAGGYGVVLPTEKPDMPSVSVFMKNSANDTLTIDASNNEVVSTKAVIDGRVVDVKIMKAAYDSLAETKPYLGTYTGMTKNANGIVTGLSKDDKMGQYVKDFDGFNGTSGLYAAGVITMKKGSAVETFRVSADVPVFVFDGKVNTVAKTTVDAFSTELNYKAAKVVLDPAEMLLNNNEVVTAIYVSVGE